MKKDISKYCSRILLLGVFVFLVHGAKLNSPIIGIDTEDIIRLQGDFYTGWRQSGRQGLILSKLLLGTFEFNPYFAGLMTLLFFGGAVWAFLRLWDNVWEAADPAGAGCSRSESGSLLPWGWLAAGFLWISHPVMTEQLYFSLQSLEICAGLLLTALSLYLARRGVEEGRKSCVSACFFLLLVIFSMYQVFVVVYVFGVLSMLVLKFAGELKLWGTDQRTTCGAGGGTGLKSAEGAVESGGKLSLSAGMWKAVFQHGALFLAAFGVNMIITGAFFNAGSGYLSGQIQWGCVSPKEGIFRILDHGFRVCTGWNSLYYNAGFGLLCLAAAWLALRAVMRLERSRRMAGVLWLLLLAALLSTPFWMTFLCAGAPVVRSQLVLPAVTGFLAYFVFKMSRQAGLAGRSGGSRKAPVGGRRLWKALGAVILTLVIWSQVQTTLRLYYTDECRYQQDAALGRELITAAKRLEGSADSAIAGNMGLVVVGSRPFSPNNACVAGETIGHSFFDFDTEVEPECYWSTRRVVGFLHTLGYDIGHASRENCEKAVEDSSGRPCWPQEGSVWRMGDVIVVKLSECRSFF